jgi:tetratricopeptide (TPR) repeat protein
MSILRLFRFGLRAAETATPHVKASNAAKHASRTEGARHTKAGNWQEAEKHLRQALEQEKNSNPHRLEMLLELTKVELQLNKLQSARQTAEAAVELARQMKDRQAMSDSLEALSEVHIAGKDFEGALSALTEAAKLSGLPSRNEMVRKAKILRKQGVALMACGLREESRSVLEKALKLAERVYGARHAETAHALSEMGALYREAGEHDSAQIALRRALEIYRETAGQDSPEASMGLHNLAMSLEASGNLDEAMEEYERILAVRERQLGGSREATAEIEARLALLYVNAGRIAPARELLAHAIGVLERGGGERYMLALETLAVADEISGRHAEAERSRAKLNKLNAELESLQAS